MRLSPSVAFGIYYTQHNYLQLMCQVARPCAWGRYSGILMQSQMIIEKVRRLIDQYVMFNPREPVVVAVSGGPDSVCLLQVLYQLRNEYQIKLHLAHLNHRLRGEEAEEDARYVQALAKKLGLPATTRAFDVGAYMRQRHLSAQEGARQVRYAFLAEVAARIGASRIAVGHNADDQVETVTMNWLRGAGLTGLRGMLPVADLRLEDSSIEVQGPDVGEVFSESQRQGVDDETGPCEVRAKSVVKLVRPLLEVTRAEIEDYLSREGIKPRRDLSNEKRIYLRNRIRQELIPSLENYNPRFRQAVLRASESMAGDYDYLQAQACEAWNRLARPTQRLVTFDSPGWLALHPALQRYLLRFAVTHVAESVRDLEWEHVEEMREVIRGKTVGTGLDLPQGVRLLKGYVDFVVGRSVSLEEDLRREAEWPVLYADRLPLIVPGEVDLPGTPWRITATLAERAGEAGPGPFSTSIWEANMDYAAAGPDLFLRRRRPGDSFRPLGLGGSKSLQDFMVDAKIPQWLRDYVPLVANPNQIFWVVAWRMDDRVKITDQTRRVLRLEVNRRSE